MILQLISDTTPHQRDAFGKPVCGTIETLTAQTVRGPVTISLRSHAGFSDGLWRHFQAATKGKKRVWQHQNGVSTLSF